MKNEINGKVLTSWLNMTTAINNDKMTSSLPFNEAMVCRYLYQHASEHVIASQLCEWLGMQKSQMNRTIMNMEKKNLIHRVRNEEDRRQIFLVLNDEMMEIYRKQHKHILRIIDAICDELGEEKSNEVAGLFEQVAMIAKEVID